MHLTPREHERLLLAAAADLARRRLARGARLGATEAVALVCDEVCELAWDGVPLPEVIARARTVIPPAALLPGVAGLVPVIEVEALFPWGSTLVHVDAPFADDQGPGAEVPGSGQEQPEAERVLLAPGTARSPSDGPGEPGRSGRPGRPGEPGGPADGAGPAASGARYGPGAVLPAAGVIELAAGAERRAALLRNTGPRDVWISSHFPLGEVNPAVRVRWADAAEPVPVPDEAPGPGPDARARDPGPGARARDPGPGARARDPGPGARARDPGPGARARDPGPGAGNRAGTPGPGAGPGNAGGGRRPWRLDLPAGEALLLRAGEERQVTVVARPG